MLKLAYERFVKFARIVSEIKKSNERPENNVVIHNHENWDEKSAKKKCEYKSKLASFFSKSLIQSANSLRMNVF